MSDIKYNNVATVRFHSVRQANRFLAIVSPSRVQAGCKLLTTGKAVSLFVPQDLDKEKQLDYMRSFRQAAEFHVASERAKLSERIRGTKRTRQALKDVLDSFLSLQSGDANDTEAMHVQADRLLCSALEALGQKAIVEAWRKVGKRYA